MTLDEWFDALAETRAKFHWELQGGKIRTVVDGVCLCPLTAVYADATGKLLDARRVHEMPHEFYPAGFDGSLARSADKAWPRGHVVVPKLRRRMLQTLGLEAV